MIDVIDILRVAYIDLLTGLADEGRPVPVYSGMAENNAVAPYVILNNAKTTEDNTKDTAGHQVLLVIDVVTRFRNGVQSWLPATRIATAILERLKPNLNTIGIHPVGLHVWNLKIQVQELTMVTPADILYRKLLTITHALELTNTTLP